MRSDPVFTWPFYDELLDLEFYSTPIKNFVHLDSLTLPNNLKRFAYNSYDNYDGWTIRDDALVTEIPSSFFDALPHLETLWLAQADSEDQAAPTLDIKSS